MSRGYRLPAVRFTMGTRLDCFQTSVHVSEIPQVLGHDPRSRAWSALERVDPKTAELYKLIQRKSPSDRVDALKEYMRSRFRTDRDPRILGALPAISIAFQSPITDFHLSDPSSREIGELVLPPGRRILLDGLQRVTAALDYYQNNEEVNEWFEFAATFYFPKDGAVLTDRDLGQMFFDMNYKQKAMSAIHAMKLDQADPYLQLTNDWNEDGIIKELGGVEDSASLGKKSTAFVSRKHLFKFIRGAVEGRKAQDQDKYQPDEPRLNDENYSDYSIALQQFLMDLRTGMGEEAFADRSSIHLSSGGWQVLGLIFHDINVILDGVLSQSDRAQAVNLLARIDWSRYNHKWIELFGDSEVDGQGRERLSKTTRWGRAIKDEMLRYVREQCGIARHLPTVAESNVEDDSLVAVN